MFKNGSDWEDLLIAALLLAAADDAAHGDKVIGTLVGVAALLALRFAVRGLAQGSR